MKKEPSSVKTEDTKDVKKEDVKKEDEKKDEKKDDKKDDKKEEKKEPEPLYEMLQNPARVMRSQVDIIISRFILCVG